ncbi:MAG: hypothetical protein COA78_02265 [Blastopirellula sp.]|nr:MAG: hypothetical protein COA78_02265 [Blastopirellula sp.]
MKRILTLVVGLCLLFSMGCGEDIVIEGDSSSTSANGSSSTGTKKVASSKPSTNRAGSPQTKDRLKAIMMAIHNYHDTHLSFPPPYFKDENGQPAHSWRVILLPHLGENALYQQYDFNQPWDSEQNQRVMKKIPKVYQTSGSQPYTTIQGIVGEGTAFDPTMEKIGFRDVKDGLSNTMMLIERVNKPVLWTKPEDISPEDWIAGKSFANLDAEGHYVAFTDGSQWFYRTTWGEKSRMFLTYINDGEGTYWNHHID